VEIIIQNWISLNSRGNFKASPSYCRARLSEGAKQELLCKNLKVHFATTLNHPFHSKLGIKPSQAADGKSHMQTFWSGARAKKKLASKFSPIQKIY